MSELPKIVSDERVPFDEAWFTAPVGWSVELMPSGFGIRLTRHDRILGKIVGLRVGDPQDTPERGTNEQTDRN